MCQLFLTPFFQIVFDCFSCICIKKFYTLLYRDGGGGWVEVVGGREAWHSAVYGVAKSWTWLSNNNSDGAESDPRKCWIVPVNGAV